MNVNDPYRIIPQAKSPMGRPRGLGALAGDPDTLSSDSTRPRVLDLGARPNKSAWFDGSRFWAQSAPVIRPSRAYGSSDSTAKPRQAAQRRRPVAPARRCTGGNRGGTPTATGSHVPRGTAAGSAAGAWEGDLGLKRSGERLARSAGWAQRLRRLVYVVAYPVANPTEYPDPSRTYTARVRACADRRTRRLP